MVSETIIENRLRPSTSDRQQMSRTANNLMEYDQPPRTIEIQKFSMGVILKKRG
jgi:hypothetical protein